MILDPSGVEPQLQQVTPLEEKNVHNREYRQSIEFRNSDVREPDCFGQADNDDGSIKSYIFLTETEGEILRLLDFVPGHRPFLFLKSQFNKPFPVLEPFKNLLG